MLAIIGGCPSRFAPLVELYKRALDERGYPLLPGGMHSLGFVATTDEEAVDIQFPHWLKTFEAASAERGWARPTRRTFEGEGADGSLYLGSPETLATKMAANIRLLGLSRFDLAYAVGAVPHEQRMGTIALYGREVIPRVRELLAAPCTQSAPSDQHATANPVGSRA